MAEHCKLARNVLDGRGYAVDPREVHIRDRACLPAPYAEDNPTLRVRSRYLPFDPRTG